MQIPALLDFRQFPDSPYANELRRDFPDLQFSPALEREFQAFHLERVRARVRFFQLAICLLCLAVGVHLVTLDGMPAQAVLTSWLGLAVPLSLFLLWSSWSRFYERIYLPVSRVALPLLGVISGVGIAGRILEGHPDPFFFLTSYSIALYFLGGQLFREALLANVLLIVSHGVALAYVGEPPESVVYYVSVLTITAAVGAFVYSGVERQLRTSFLERGLMGEMAARDGLTGLKNRGAFDDHFPRMWQQGLRDRRSLALLLIDVDHFKAYNDRYGHQAGDQALRRVAQVVQGFARRPLDMAARYGGEEFVVALFDLSAEYVQELAEELRNAILALQIAHEDSPTAQFVTASIGASVVRPKAGRSPEGALQLADESLYSAKRGGRNCVKVVDCDYALFTTGNFRRRA
ncbi:MAG TPA: GGDEF domain-containing protein [Steroidobacteraceae bacterium]|nr:GGDEF domain-containing protein [Steroidobacteraceae bacterium]